jgi:hypothetical protein
MLPDRAVITNLPSRECEAAIDLHSNQLGEQGYCIIADAMELAAVEELDAELATTFAETPFCTGGFYGGRTKRFGRLLARSEHAAAFVQHEAILGVVERILSPWCDTIQLNLTQAIELHPGALSQLPHRDQDMWRGDIGRAEYLVNVMWPLTEFTADNGATLIWPDSHGARALDPEPQDAPIAAAMSPGAALLFLGSTLHGAGGNTTIAARRGLIVSYCLGWLKPYENQWLAYPPPIARGFTPELAALVGYRQHRPNLGNYEGHCPSILLGPGHDRPLGAIDALRPDQTELVEAYVEDQRRRA